MITIRSQVLSLWFWSVLAMLTLFGLPFLTNALLTYQHGWHEQQTIAPLFTEQVQYWENDIERWAQAYEIDPNLIATIMQIESCGHPTVISHAGARGLFQVMPFHFDAGENMLDPQTNAFRSTNFIRECTAFADGDIGLTLACYNGGPSVTMRSIDTWPQETQRYYRWGTGIYQDAVRYANRSDTLDAWLSAGGINLCQSAGVALDTRYP